MKADPAPFTFLKKHARRWRERFVKRIEMQRLLEAMKSKNYTISKAKLIKAAKRAAEHFEKHEFRMDFCQLLADPVSEIESFKARERWLDAAHPRRKP